jgi:hypothetical protein
MLVGSCQHRHFSALVLDFIVAHCLTEDDSIHHAFCIRITVEIYGQTSYLSEDVDHFSYLELASSKTLNCAITKEHLISN